MVGIVVSCILAMLIASGHPAGAESWTLDRAVKTALESSNAIAVELIGADEAMLNASDAGNGQLPTVSLSAGAQVVSEVMEINMPGKKIRFGDYDSYDLKLKVNQLIYDGGRLKSFREAGINRSEMNVLQAEAAELAVEFQAKSAFFHVVMAEEAAKSVRESMKEAENHLNDVRALFSQGMAIENDVLRARLRISMAELELTSGEADIERAKARFRKVVGIPPGDEVTIAWNVSQADSGSVAAGYDEALGKRPEVKAFDAALEASDYTIGGARAGKYPNIALFGAFNYGKPGLDLPANEWMHYFSGGVSMNWNIWDWGKTRREIEKAEMNKQKIVHNRSDFERSLAEQISEAATACREARKRADLASETVTVSKQNLDLISSAYREGMATETDYDSAHAAYTAAVHKQSGAQVAVYLSKAYINYVMGIRYSGDDNE